MKRSLLLIIISMIVTVLVYSFFLGHYLNEGTKALNIAFGEVEDLRQSQYDWLIRVQSNELLSLRSAFRSLSEVKPKEEILNFVREHLVNTRIGMDGLGIAIAFDGDQNLVFASESVVGEISVLQKYATTSGDILFPKHLRSGYDDFHFPSIRYQRIYWNKIVVPEIGENGDSLVIFYGFREDIVLAESGAAFAKARSEIGRFAVFFKNIYTVTGMVMIIMILIGLILMNVVRRV